MNLITKICLAVSLFAVSASVAWAGFNYDSAHNYFLIDSILKSGGSYILIGDAFNEISNAFAVSNSLIFSNPAGQFISGTRQMDKNQFATSQIQVQSPNTFNISAGTSALKLGSSTPGSLINIKMANDFILDPQGQGLALIDLTSPAAKTIYANKVLTNSLQLYAGNSVLSTSPGSKLTISAGGTASATAITVGNSTTPFCQKITWTVNNNLAKDGTSNPTLNSNPTGDKVNPIPCPTGGGAATPPTGDYTQRTCCPTNYYIYDLNYTAGKMVCCQAK